jgi:predicted enzyme related to lactoylglutathione lyase
MNAGIGLIVYPVKDLAAAKSVFTTLLGVEPYVDQPYYVGYHVGDTEVGLDPNAHRQGVSVPIGYREVTDIEESLQALEKAGATVRQSPRDVGGGLLVATVTDADGNVLGLRQPPQQ